MKNLIIYIIIILTSTQIYGQKRPKYEDQLANILRLPTAGRTVLLKIYQADDPSNVSIDFQLAIIYEDRFIDSDILTDHEYKLGNAKEALFYYKKARFNVNEKEVKKNEELYINFGQYSAKGKLTVSFDSINNRIQNAIPILEAFVENAPGIYEKFTKSFSHYDRAHKLFVELLGNYRTEKDLLLLYNAEMDENFEKIKQEYLSSVEAFEAYKKAIEVYSINYNQQLSIKELETYRLDGLEAEINFLKDNVEIWNYAKWVDNTRLYIKEKIDALRKDLTAENLRVNQILAKTNDNFLNNQPDVPLEISKEILFTLRKYDLQSVIEPLFLYKESKHDLLIQDLISNNLDSDSTIDNNRKLYLYGQMLNKIRNANDILDDIDSKNTDITHAKYNTFLTSQYKGKNGITQYVSEERVNNVATFNNSASNIREMLFDHLTVSINPSEASYKRQVIPLEISAPVDDELITDAHITTHKITNFDGSSFIGGIKRNTTENKVQAFVCGVTPNGKIGWYKDFLLTLDSDGTKAHTRLAAITVVPGGSIFLLNGYNPETQETVNHLITLDETGEEKLNIQLLLDDYPRTINYNEQANTLLVTFKGKDYTQNISLSSSLVMAYYNILGDRQWQQKIDYKGDIIDVTSTSNSFIISGNYNEIKGMDGTRISAGSPSATKVFQLKLNSDGSISDLNTINTSSPYFGYKTYKVSDDCINILGSKGSFNTQTTGLDRNPESYVHIITNNKLEVLYKSMD